MDLSQDIKYITAKEASALTGYVADYITRQCRAGKIASRQIGRVWLIDQESLLSHFALEAARKEENAKALARAREAEYAAARKAREEADPVPEAPIESPFAPVPVNPSWFLDTEPTRKVQGSFAALAVTLSILSAGLYAGLPETQRVALASVYRVGTLTVGLTEEVAVVLNNTTDRSSEKILALKEREVVSVEQRRPSMLEIPSMNELVAALSVPEISAPKLVAYSPPNKNLFTSLGDVFTRASSAVQAIPQRVVHLVYGLGIHIASTGNEAPFKTFAFVRSLEGEALGVIGHIALAYDTAKIALSGVYDYAPRANLAAVSEATAVRAEEASDPNTLSVFETTALFTYKTVNAFFAGVGNSFASLFAPKNEDGTHYVPDNTEEEEKKVIAVAPTSGSVVQTQVSEVTSYSVPIYNEYYTITSTGVSKEYVDSEIRRHIENLDDRIDKRLDNIGGGGGGGGSGSVTSVDMSGGTTGLSFAGGPITSSGVFTLSGTLAIANGGTGIATAPTYGQLLMGNGAGGYSLVATSSLGISGSGGTPGGSDGEVQFNQGGVFGAESAFSYASTTNTLSVTGGVIQSTSGIFRGDDEYHQIIFHNVGNNTDYIEWGDTLAASGGHRFYTGGASPTLRAQIADDGMYLQGPVGIGTTSPWAQLSINPNGITGPAFVIGSSTATNFVVTNGGSVGVGTTAPEEKLHIGAGNIAIDRTYSYGVRHGGAFVQLVGLNSGNVPTFGPLLGNTNTRITLGVLGAGDIQLQANAKEVIFQNLALGGESARLTGTGNLGLGTSSPYAKLSVVGAVVGEYFHATSTTATSTFSGGLRLPLLGTSAGSFLAVDGTGEVIATTTPGGSSYTFTYPLQNSANTISLAFGTTTSNIWAGTQTFSYASSTAISSLYASSTAGFLGTLAIGGPTSTTFQTEFGSRTFSNYTDSTATNGYAFVLGRGADADNTSAPNFYFTRNNGSSASIVDGNYIGRLSALPWDGDEGVFSSAINFRVNGTVSDNSIPTDITFETGTQNSMLAERMRITSGGNVGVGSTTPWAQLSINPNGITGPAFAIGSSTATNFVVTNRGYVGIGTTSPYTKLGVEDATDGATLFDISSTVASPAVDTTLLRLSASADADVNTKYIRAYGNNGSSLMFEMYSENSSTDRTVLSSGAHEMYLMSRNISFLFNTDLASGDAFVFNGSAVNRELTGSSGQQSVVRIKGDFEQSGTAAADALLIDTTFSTLGTGASGVGNNLFRAVNTGVTKFLINTNGLVGIGTTSPFANLSVHANNGDTNTTLFAVGSSTASATTTLFSVLNSGNVGIGTSSPFFVSGVGLAIQNSGAAAALTLNRADASTPGSLDLLSGLTSNAILGRGAKDLTFGTNGTENMRIMSGGNVGIGTTSPEVGLSINAADSFGLLHLTNSSVNGTASISFRSADDANGGAGQWLVGKNLGGLTGDQFSIWQGTAGNRVTIDSSGNVGIGTADPSAAKLHIASPNNSSHLYATDESGNLRVAIGVDSSANALIYSGNSVDLRLGVNTADDLVIKSSGNVGIGTTSPWRRLSVTDTSAQFVTGYDSERYTQFSTDSVGDLTLDPQGGDIFALDENLYICAGGACPSGTPSAAGTIVAETALGIASSTPWAGVSVASGKALVIAENTLATSTSMTIDWRNGNQQLVRLGTSATTISFSGYIEGQKLTLTVCNPGATAGAVSWGTQILWSGGSAPTQTTTSNKCDVWSFLATQATSTMKIFGSQSANF